MTFYRPLSLRTGGRKRIFIRFFCVIPPSQYPPSGFAGHLLINKEAYPIPILPVRIPFLNTVTNPLLSLWMTPYWFPTMGADPSYPLSMTINVSLIMTPFPPIVILSGRKNALWENREAAMWHWAKNLSLWWRLTDSLTIVADPSHSFRMTFYGLLHHDSEPSSSLRVIPDRPPSEEAAGARSAAEDTRLS